jgi:hypothetical protein
MEAKWKPTWKPTWKPNGSQMEAAKIFFFVAQKTTPCGLLCVCVIVIIIIIIKSSHDHCCYNYY